jgi:preprotein translocase subunit Sss1
LISSRSEKIRTNGSRLSKESIKEILKKAKKPTQKNNLKKGRYRSEVR